MRPQWPDPCTTAPVLCPWILPRVGASVLPGKQLLCWSQAQVLNTRMRISLSKPWCHFGMRDDESLARSLVFPTVARKGERGVCVCSWRKTETLRDSPPRGEQETSGAGRHPHGPHQRSHVHHRRSCCHSRSNFFIFPDFFFSFF